MSLFESSATSYSFEASEGLFAGQFKDSPDIYINSDDEANSYIALTTEFKSSLRNCYQF
jgi:hypothetical protein